MVIKYFNTKTPIVLQVDVSSSELGAVIMREKRPVAFVSHSLTGPDIQMLKEWCWLLFLD